MRELERAMADIFEAERSGAEPVILTRLEKEETL